MGGIAEAEVGNEAWVQIGVGPEVVDMAAKDAVKCSTKCSTRPHRTRPAPTHPRHTFRPPSPAQVRPPMPPVYFFCIDVSYAAVASGAVATTAAAIKACLDQLPGDERTLVGFLTFDR